MKQHNPNSPFKEDSALAPQTFKRCYESHPALVVNEFKVYGGSCSSPIIPDADAYVGLDFSMKRSILAFPWETGESFLYHIPDMKPPPDAISFNKLIDWLAEQVSTGKKVHVGCIGGHGRTGTVLAALVSVLTGEKDAIEYVRKNYCPKAVESQSQVDFLVKYFGVKATHGAKEGWEQQPSAGYRGRGRIPQAVMKSATVHELSSHAKEVAPSKSPMSIWGPQILFDKSAESGIITP